RYRCYLLSLLFAAGIGAAEAVVFPLFSVPVWAAYLIKIAGGVIISLVAVWKAKIKAYFIVTAAFFLMTFAFGGLLVAAYSFFGVEYTEGNGYLVERAPVALVLGMAGAFAVGSVLAIRFFYRYRRIKRNLFACVLSSGKKSVRVTGLADSGNLLTFRNKPVSVISAITALALFHGNAQEVGRMAVNTVSGSREAPVFECSLEVALAKKKIRHESVYVTVGNIQSKEYKLILHTANLEGEDETVTQIKEVARKNKGKRERRKLPVRK
ncbi:MAG: sigma-E processing peptidase SpoIIGA, partial [Clostridia bacterium]|nr:sigma-E processing peptidase SpoIIGA [Clostridia bacterium]